MFNPVLTAVLAILVAVALGQSGTQSQFPPMPPMSSSFGSSQIGGSGFNSNNPPSIQNSQSGLPIVQTGQLMAASQGMPQTLQNIPQFNPNQPPPFTTAPQPGSLNPMDSLPSEDLNSYLPSQNQEIPDRETLPHATTRTAEETNYLSQQPAKIPIRGNTINQEELWGVLDARIHLSHRQQPLNINGNQRPVPLDFKLKPLYPKKPSPSAPARYVPINRSHVLSKDATEDSNLQTGGNSTKQNSTSAKYVDAPDDLALPVASGAIEQPSNLLYRGQPNGLLDQSNNLLGGSNNLLGSNGLGTALLGGNTNRMRPSAFGSDRSGNSGSGSGLQYPYSSFAQRYLPGRNSQNGQPGQNGATSYGPAQSSYGPPQQYGNPQNSPYGAPNSYGIPDAPPYGAPNSYGVPNAPSYGAPNTQPYGVPPNPQQYGYPPNSQGYIPQNSPNGPYGSGPANVYPVSGPVNGGSGPSGSPPFGGVSSSVGSPTNSGSQPSSSPSFGPESYGPMMDPSSYSPVSRNSRPPTRYYGDEYDVGPMPGSRNTEYYDDDSGLQAYAPVGGSRMHDGGSYRDDDSTFSRRGDPSDSEFRGGSSRPPRGGLPNDGRASYGSDSPYGSNTHYGGGGPYGGGSAPYGGGPGASHGYPYGDTSYGPYPGGASYGGPPGRAPNLQAMLGGSGFNFDTNVDFNDFGIDPNSDIVG